jgi:aminocarboxymuconate-semialdehyde decarboxylase
VIDVHAHYFPRSVLKELASSPGDIGVAYRAGERVLEFPSGPTRPLSDPMSDLAIRRSWNTRRGISRQILSPWMDLTGDDLPKAQSVRWARLLNDAVAAEIEGDDDLSAFATLPVGAGRDAATELQRCVRELGFVGGVLPTSVRGRNLHDADLEPVFEAAQDLDAPLFLHPGSVVGADRMASHFLWNICGYPLETTIAALGLFFSGMMERYPRLRVLLSHCGGTLPFIAGRASHASRHQKGMTRPTEAPEEILDFYFYDSIVHDPTALGFAIRRVGFERVAMGTDVPFPMEIDDPAVHLRTALDLAGLDDDAFDRITIGTPLDLIGESRAVFPE